MNDKPATRLRLLVLLATRELSSKKLAERLAQRRPALEKRFGADASVLIGVARADDPFSKIGGSRKIESADAILQASWAGDWPVADLIKRVRGLGEELSDVADINRSALAVGRAYLMDQTDGPIFCAFLGRRDPRVTLEEMRNWWLYRHGPLAMSLTVAHVRHGYDQLHVEPETSERACEAAGFPYVPYDMADSLYIPDLPKFIEGTSDPEISRRLYEDEVGFLDHTSWRGVFTDVV
jgi:EthD domain